MRRSFLLIILALAASTWLANSQEKIIKIWPLKVPGAIDNPAYKVETDSDNNWVKTRNISDPTLDVYPVPVRKSNGTAVIICPGGAYWALAIKHEGSQVATWLNSLGITAFVLKYRLPNDAIMKNKSIGPLQDAQEAMRLVRRNAKNWNINPDKIGIMGILQEVILHRHYRHTLMIKFMKVRLDKCQTGFLNSHLPGYFDGL